MIINQDKPAVGNPETYLNIGEGFRLVVGGVFKLIAGTANLLSGMTNIAKVTSYETWATITTTWATETRTWLDMGSLFDNASKPVTSIVNESKP